MDDGTRRDASASGLSIDMLLGTAGAIVGAVVGYFLFFAIARHGFYAIILPGALLGLGCAALSGRKSVALGVICGVLGLAAGIYTEWSFAPFVKDKSLSFFLAHLLDVNRVSQVLIVIGGALAFWFGVGRESGLWIRKRKSKATDGG